MAFLVVFTPKTPCTAPFFGISSPSDAPPSVVRRGPFGALRPSGEDYGSLADVKRNVETVPEKLLERGGAGVERRAMGRGGW